MAAVVAVVAASVAMSATAVAGAGAGKDKPEVTAITVRPIHEAQVVRGDDGKDHVEYDLLVVNVVGDPVTLSSVTVLDRAGNQLGRIDGDTLAAATQNLFPHTPVAETGIPSSGAAAVEVDLALAPGTVPAQVTNRIAYSVPQGSDERGDPRRHRGPSGRPQGRGQPPTRHRDQATPGGGWLARRDRVLRTQPPPRSSTRHRRSAHRHRGNVRTSTWAGSTETCSMKATAPRTSSSSASEPTCWRSPTEPWSSPTTASRSKPRATAIPATKLSQIGGNKVILQIAPKVFAAYEHLQPDSLTVKVGDKVKAGAVLAKLGNTGPSTGPHLHFGLLDRPNVVTGRALPFVFDHYTLAGTVDIANAQGDEIVIMPESRQVRSAYPLWGSIQNFPVGPRHSVCGLERMRAIAADRAHVRNVWHTSEKRAPEHARADSSSVPKVRVGDDENLASDATSGGTCVSDEASWLT